MWLFISMLLGWNMVWMFYGPNPLAWSWELPWTYNIPNIALICAVLVSLSRKTKEKT